MVLLTPADIFPLNAVTDYCAAKQAVYQFLGLCPADLGKLDPENVTRDPSIPREKQIDKATFKVSCALTGGSRVAKSYPRTRQGFACRAVDGAFPEWRRACCTTLFVLFVPSYLPGDLEMCAALVSVSRVVQQHGSRAWHVSVQQPEQSWDPESSLGSRPSQSRQVQLFCSFEHECRKP